MYIYFDVFPTLLKYFEHGRTTWRNKRNLKKCSVHHLFVFLAKTFLRLLMSASIGFFFFFSASSLLKDLTMAIREKLNWVCNSSPARCTIFFFEKGKIVTGLAYTWVFRSHNFFVWKRKKFLLLFFVGCQMLNVKRVI